MKKFIYCICIIVLLFLISIIPTSAKEIKTCIRTNKDLKVPSDVKKDDINAILNTPCVDDVDKIYDFADLLTDSEESLLYDEVKQFIDKNKYDLVLVTTNENPELDAMNYADDFYDYNFFGINKTRDGILMLIDMVNRELYISTSGYAIKMYDDFRIESILDDGYSYIKDEEYYNTFSSMIKSLDKFYSIGYPSSNEDLLIDEFGNSYYLKYIPYRLVFFIAFVITFIISLILYFKSRLKIKVHETISYLKDKNLDTKTDTLVNTVVTHTLRQTTSSSSGSSRSGGSSFHSSSSGRSHGGGGRKF